MTGSSVTLTRRRRTTPFMVAAVIGTWMCSFAAIAEQSNAASATARNSKVRAERSPRSTATFAHPTVIDNKLYPMAPGTQWILEGNADRGPGTEPHRLLITVTDLTKVVHGITTVVVWEADINRGRTVESELAFFAQDDAGNVWNLGEYPEEFTARGAFSGAPNTWISGRRRAQGGIQIEGRPVVGSPSYVQGVAPAVGFFDQASVATVDRRDCSPIGCFRGVVVIKEWNNDPGDGHQLKAYAPGIGILGVRPRGGTEHEELTLVARNYLDDAQRSEVAIQARNLDQRGYRYGGHDYRSTAVAVERDWFAQPFRFAP